MRTNLAALAVFVALSAVRADQVPVPTDKLPKAVADAVKKRLPKAEIGEASKITEDGKTVYSVSASEGTKHFDLTIAPDGALLVIEKDIPVADIPKAVLAGFKEKHPKATIVSAQEVLKVDGGKEVVEAFEIVFTTVAKKTFAAELTPDGKLKQVQEITDNK